MKQTPAQALGGLSHHGPAHEGKRCVLMIQDLSERFAFLST